MNSEGRDSLHFAFCCSDDYAPYAAVCIRSILLHKNKDEIVVHILTDYLSYQSMQKLKEAAKAPENELVIHQIDDKELQNLPLNIWSVHTWYRILLPDILPESVEKVLYLDCDTLIVDNISNLFKLNINDFAFAAVEDPQSYNPLTYERCGYSSKNKYICAGVMLLNLTYWRKMNLKDRLIEYAQQNKETIKYPDQDALNVVCKDVKVILPLKFGFMDAFFQDQVILDQLSKKELEEALRNPAIIHYAGCAPWIKESRPSIFHKEWDNVNKTLKHRAKVGYKCSGLRSTKFYNLKKIIYKIFYPVIYRRIIKNHITKDMAWKMINCNQTGS